MAKISLRQWVNFLAVLLTIGVNGLANALPINGQTTGEISDRFEVFFVPAGYVFSIWGLIYIGLLAYGIYQLLPAQRENQRLRRIGYLPALSAVFNISWLLFWHYEYFVLTMVAMLALLLTLIVIYLRLEIGREKESITETVLINLPFSIYLGWITVATIANATSTLDYLDWSAWGISPEIWTIIMLATGVVIAALIALTRGDVAYLLVLIWAFAGIAIKHADNEIVSTASWGAAIIVGILVLAAIFRNRNYFRVVQTPAAATG